MFRFVQGFAAVAIALSSMCFGGCATLINSENQSVAFNTEPDGATVSIDGVAVGKTPVVIPVARKGGDKMVQFDLAGYKSVQFKLKNTLDAALAGNILFGGFIGLGIDAISGKGGGYQSSVKVVLERGSGLIIADDDKKEKSEPPKKEAPSGGSRTPY